VRTTAWQRGAASSGPGLGLDPVSSRLWAFFIIIFIN
jgi:hypothetical protein